MVTIADLLDETLRAARAARWPQYHERFSALREALAGRLSPADEELCVRLDLLNAAAPEHDPQGCLAELEALCAALKGKAVWKNECAAPQAAMDLRGLQPPEPILRIFQALERAPNEPLRVILPHEPQPLYGLLRQRGFSFSGAPREDGGYELLIEAR